MTNAFIYPFVVFLLIQSMFYVDASLAEICKTILQIVRITTSASHLFRFFLKARKLTIKVSSVLVDISSGNN